MNEGELIEALNIILADPNSEKNSRSLMMVLSRYAELAPTAAMDFTLSNITLSSQRSRAISIALNMVIKQDPQKAYDWFKVHEQDLDGVMSEGSLIPIFNGLATENLSSAIHELDELSLNPKGASMAIIGIANTLSDSSEYQLLLNSVQSMNDNRLTTSALAAWGRAEPQDAAVWIESLENQEQSNRLANRLLSSWLRKEPDQAADWYMNTPNDMSRQKKAETVAQSMSYPNPEDALTWINKQTNIDPATSYKSLLSTTAFSNPDFSIANLYLIENKEDKASVSYSIYSGLQQISQTKADAFLAESSVKDELTKKIERFKRYRQKAKSKE